MGLFSKLFKKSTAESSGETAASEQAVLVHLDGMSLSDEVYEQHDLATLEDHLVSAITAAGSGELDGNETGPEGTVVYLYGPDAEALFASVESVLSSYPLCRNARVEIRRGGPGAPQRELRLPAVE